MDPSAETRRIILADDNADMREYVHRLLSDRWSVDAYPDGRAALEAVRRHAPALVIADVMMPELDGFELLRELQADPATAQVPVILLSARAGEEARIEGLQAGACDYLVKPFSARELRARVDAQILRSEIRATQEAHARRLADIFRQAPVAIAILRGPDHTYEFANDPYLELVGHRPMLGKPLLEALPELADQGIKELLDGVRSSGKPFVGSSIRVLLNRGAGGAAEEAFFKLVYQPMLDGDGQVQRHRRRRHRSDRARQRTPRRRKRESCEGRVHRHVEPRAAQSALAHPDGAAAHEAARHRCRRTRADDHRAAGRSPRRPGR